MLVGLQCHAKMSLVLEQSWMSEVTGLQQDGHTNA